MAGMAGMEADIACRNCRAEMPKGKLGISCGMEAGAAAGMPSSNEPADTMLNRARLGWIGTTMHLPRKHTYTNPCMHSPAQVLPLPTHHKVVRAGDVICLGILGAEVGVGDGGTGGDVRDDAIRHHATALCNYNVA